MISRPAFASVDGAYTTDSTKIHICNLHFPNTCAIRMSEALAKARPGLHEIFKSVDEAIDT
jgi:hypothetical protein